MDLCVHDPKSAIGILEETTKIPKEAIPQLIQKFLGKVGEKIGDVGVHLLKKYLEGQLDL